MRAGQIAARISVFMAAAGHMHSGNAGIGQNLRFIFAIFRVVSYSNPILQPPFLQWPPPAYKYIAKDI